MNDAETKYKEIYKEQLLTIEKYINNPYIYNIILNYKTIKDGVIYKLHSNINTYEMVFLAKLAELNKANDILEIGCANGTSGMILVNSLIKNGGGKLISIDPFQETQWHNVGKYNINKVIELNKTNSIITYELIQELSSKTLNKFVKNNIYFDLIFVDGSHSYIDVVIDIYCSLKILKKGGLIVIDDVLHDGVKLVINDLKYISNIEKIHLEEKENFNIVKSNYNYTTFNKSYTNPRTMYAYRKL